MMNCTFDRLFRALRFGRVQGRSQQRESSQVKQSSQKSTQRVAQKGHTLLEQQRERAGPGGKYISKEKEKSTSPRKQPQNEAAKKIPSECRGDVQIDAVTTVPYDLYKDLVKAGRNARHRGQHQVQALPAYHSLPNGASRRGTMRLVRSGSTGVMEQRQSQRIDSSEEAVKRASTMPAMSAMSAPMLPAGQEQDTTLTLTTRL